jgi:DNA repair protein RecO (recombination protein O)
LSKTRDRYTLNSAKPKYSFHELGNDIEKLALASYFAQAIKYCTPQEQLQLYLTKESFVKFLAYALYEITNASPRAAGQENEKLRTLENIRSTFELRYSCMMGYIPNLVGCSNCGKYESEHMVFLPEFAEIICGECFDWSYDGEYTDLMPDTLWCMRNIIYAAADKCFKFGTTAAVEKQLSAFTENYFLNKTERTFGALDYYKSLSDNR